jgi:hypothetical protein
MKRQTVLCVVSLLVMALALSGCHTPPAGEAADDIVPAPGLGPTYRANVHQEGQPSFWEPIESTELVLGDSSDAAHISYRQYIETKAGQNRNNIFWVYLPNVEPANGNLKPVSVSLNTINLPAGMTITQTGEWHGADPARQSKISLRIEISPQVKPGEYAFDIAVEINGKDYGKVPCAIRVIE